MSYNLSGWQYWECSYLIAGSEEMVHHVQVCEGLPPHVTVFKWLSEDMIREILDDLFTIRIIKEGASAIYHCKRNEREA
jgi:hypothetical protein